MWLVTTFGYFSIVQKNSDRAEGTLTIRARVKADMEMLKKKYLPRLGPIDQGGGKDYPYRAKASREDVARAFGRAVMDVTYSNFKSEVAFHMGFRREEVYNAAWMQLRKLQALDDPKAAAPPVPPVETAEETADDSLSDLVIEP